MRRNFWDPDAWLYGLFEVWSFAHTKAIVASGLGGGSLIYANVILEKPAETFTVPDGKGGTRRWPLDYAALKPHYEAVEGLLNPTELPGRYITARAGRAAVPKTQQFIDAAKAAGLLDPQPAPLAVTFADDLGNERPGVPIGSDNLHGRERHTCTLVGECDLGCNEGAKNSLDYTFLSAFSEPTIGHAIRTCCEALDISDLGGAFRVRYRQHAAARARVEARADAEETRAHDDLLLDPSDAPLRSVTATVVVLAAGTFGSVQLLLRSGLGLPRLSARVGEGFSSNGDLLTFARNCKDPRTGRPRELSPSRGPVISAYATRPLDDRLLWMEDAGGPRGSEWGWQLPETGRDALALARTFMRQRRMPKGRVSMLPAGLLGSTGSSSGMLPMLTMGRDVPGGKLRLEGGSLSLDWDPRNSKEDFDAAEETAAMLAKELGGELGPLPVRGRTRGTTVHPLGGCAMAEDPSEGVVDTDGEVFGHEGLFVADGSIMPGPIGPNPSFTIAAFADRIARAAAKGIPVARQRLTDSTRRAPDAAPASTPAEVT
jgi:cholesterol oxidase